MYLGTDDENRAMAQELLAEAGVSTPIDVKFWFPTGNVRRTNEFELIKTSADSVGFNVIQDDEPNWEFTGIGYPDVNPHDATIFAWAATSLAVSGDDQYLTLGGPSNWTGYDNPEVDALLEELNVAVKREDQLRIRLAIEEKLAKMHTTSLSSTSQVLPGGTTQFHGRGRERPRSLLLLELLGLDPNRGLI